MDSIQAIRNKAKQAEGAQQFTGIASESHAETQRQSKPKRRRARQRPDTFDPEG